MMSECNLQEMDTDVRHGIIHLEKFLDVTLEFFTPDEPLARPIRDTCPYMMILWISGDMIPFFFAAAASNGFSGVRCSGPAE